jgi:hypothetical protein
MNPPCARCQGGALRAPPTGHGLDGVRTADNIILAQYGEGYAGDAGKASTGSRGG